MIPISLAGRWQDGAAATETGATSIHVKMRFHLPLKHSHVPTPNLAPATTWQTDWIFTHRDSAVLDIWSLSPHQPPPYFSELYILIKTEHHKARSAFGLQHSSA